MFARRPPFHDNRAGRSPPPLCQLWRRLPISSHSPGAPAVCARLNPAEGGARDRRRPRRHVSANPALASIARPPASPCQRRSARQDAGEDARAPRPRLRAVGMEARVFVRLNPAEGGAWVPGRPRPHVSTIPALQSRARPVRASPPTPCRAARCGRGRPRSQAGRRAPLRRRRELPGCAAIPASPPTPRRAARCGRGRPRTQAPSSAGLRVPGTPAPSPGCARRNTEEDAGEGAAAYPIRDGCRQQAVTSRPSVVCCSGARSPASAPNSLAEDAGPATAGPATETQI